MKYLQRLSCVLLVAVILFATFSTTAAAESSSDYDLLLALQYRDSGDGIVNVFDLYNDDTPTSYSWDTYYVDENAFLVLEYTISSSTDDILARKDRLTKVRISNVHLLYYFQKWTYIRNFSNVSANVGYINGEVQSFDNIQYSYDNPNGTFTFEFEPTNDVAEITISATYYPTLIDNISGSGLFTLEYLATGENAPIIDIQIQSEESGLLGGILEWIQGIFQKIGDGFQSMIDGFEDVKNGIVNLPARIWHLVSEGLKNLFVPDEEYMTNYSDQWDTLLSNRFGAIYQVADTVSTFVQRIKQSAQTQTINFPVTDLSSVGIPFSFGGYDVKIVPDNFVSVVSALKKITSIICTFLFMNALRKRYDEVMGVEQ